MSLFKDITTEIDLDYLFEEGMTIDQLDESVMQYIAEQEIIYYANAMNLLREFDPSLSESLEIAAEFGYEPQNLNSEILATLLHQQQLTNEWAEVRDEVEQIIEQLETA